MRTPILPILRYLTLLILLTGGMACTSNDSSVAEDRRAIVQTLADETRYFCLRDLRNWERQWSHADYVSKMYAGETDFEYLRGWAEIRAFTVDHLQQFPEPLPIPTTSPDYTIELFTDTALVLYSKEGERGPIQEVRFLVREEGQWKIARMQTIY